MHTEKAEKYKYKSRRTAVSNVKFASGYLDEKTLELQQHPCEIRYHNR
jgi:hypothetical protein